jgi:hypothetical protein
MITKDSTMDRRPAVLWILMGALGFLSVSALFGGAMLLVDPSGGSLEMPITYLRDSPFEDYRVPGAILFGVLGIGPMAALCGIRCRPRWSWADVLNPFKKMHWAWSASVAVGLALLVWIAVQVALIGYVSFLQPLYGAVGLVILFSSFHVSVRRVFRNRAKGRHENSHR